MFKLLLSGSMVAATAWLSPASRVTHGSKVPTSACRAADTTTALEIISLKTELHSTRPTDSAFVSGVHLPYVADSAIVVVADSTLCSTALSAHNAAAGYSGSELASSDASSLYVLRVGTVYVTFNPAFPTGEFVNHIVWDASFHQLANWF
jgi:hypothetical protein